MSGSDHDWPDDPADASGGAPARVLIALGVVSVLFAASLLFNIGLVAIWSTDESAARSQLPFVESRLEALEESKGQLENRIRQLEQEREGLNTELTHARSQLQEARKAAEQAGQEAGRLGRLAGDPLQLPAASQHQVLSRYTAFQVVPSLDADSEDVGLREAVVVEQVRRSARGVGLRIQSDGSASLSVTVELVFEDPTNPTASTGFAVLRLSVAERWRVPGESLNWPAIVADRSLVARFGSGGASSTVLDALDRLVKSLGKDITR